MGKRRRVDERKAAKSGRSRRHLVLGGVAVAALGGGAVAVYTVFGAGAGGEKERGKGKEKKKRTTPPAAEGFLRKKPSTGE
ncbi:penicillin-binding protein, partial [Streptomyces bottropensis]